MGKYLYLCHSKKQGLLKIGVTENLKNRTLSHKRKHPDLILIGYTFFENKWDAFECESLFKTDGNEWTVYLPEIVERFAKLKDAVYCESGIIDFPGKRPGKWGEIMISKKCKVDKKLLSKIIKWREKIGYQAALVALMGAGVSSSAAQKILCGAYKSNPKQLLLQAIEVAMKQGA